MNRMAEKIIARIAKGKPWPTAFEPWNDADREICPTLKTKPYDHTKNGNILIFAEREEGRAFIELPCLRSKPMKGYEGDSVGITFVKSGNVHSPVTHGLARTITTMSDHDIGVIVDEQTDISREP